MLLIHRNFIWPLRQWDLLNKLEGLGIEDINGVLTLIRAVVIQPIGMRRQVMRIRATSDEPRNLISSWIDDVLNSSGIITLQDPYGDTVIRIKSGNALGRSRRNEQKAANHYRQCTADK